MSTLITTQGNRVWPSDWSLTDTQIASVKECPDGSISLHEEDYDAPWRYQMESLKFVVTRRLRSLILGYAADIASLRRDFPKAHTLYSEALALNQTIGNREYEARILSRMGYLAAQEGDWDQAGTLFAECMTICRERHAQLGMAECLSGYAELRRLQGHVTQAVHLLATPILHRFRIITGNSFNRIAYQRSVDAARTQLDPAAFAAAWAEGSAQTLEQANAEATRAPTVQPASAAQEARPETMAGLSTCEAGVLGLLADRLINPQIAERLTLSTYTVQAHLRSIYSKLGVTSRTAATRYAMEHCLG